MKRIYFDNNATTQIDPGVFEAMLPFLKEKFGNPSSIHWAGQETKMALDEARSQVASLLHCDPLEIIFTSCGTESNNAAIKGVYSSLKEKGNHLITTQVEHPAALETCRYLEKKGAKVSYLSVNRHGELDLNELRAAIDNKTILISIMWANNETGVIFPIEEIGKIAKGCGVLFHTDAVQAVGKLEINLEKLPIDLLSLSGHKLHAPKGVGVLFVRRGIKLDPFMHGGHQERMRRAGTENLASIVALGKACQVAFTDLQEENRVKNLRDKLEKGVMEKIPGVLKNGHQEKRLPGTANLSFEKVEGESILLNLDLKGIAASSGSACTSGSLEPSHVLKAMGVPIELAHGSVRFSLSKFNKEEEVDYLLEVLPEIIERLRSYSPLK